MAKKQKPNFGCSRTEPRKDFRFGAQKQEEYQTYLNRVNHPEQRQERTNKKDN